jgi:putative hydrolase of HD superfamily
MTKPDIHRLIDFHKFLLQFQAIERRPLLPDEFNNRPENDTEHSYNLAMMAWFLCEYFPQLDRDKVIRYGLIHDLVETHAGDTYIFDDDRMLNSKIDREAEALAQIKEDWIDFPELGQNIHDYEQRTDEESKFIYALDKVMPLIMIYIGEGKTWKKLNITLPQLHNQKIPKVSVSPEIAPFYDELYELLVQSEHYFAQSKTSQQR